MTEPKFKPARTLREKEIEAEAYERGFHDSERIHAPEQAELVKLRNEVLRIPALEREVAEAQSNSNPVDSKGRSIVELEALLSATRDALAAVKSSERCMIAIADERDRVLRLTIDALGRRA